jgi:phosphoribosylglycinamide formyltransferase-1
MREEGPEKVTRFGVLISGSGTNLQAILDACKVGEVGGQVVVVISNRADAFGLEHARRAGVHAVIIDPKTYPDPDAYNHAVREALDHHEVDYVAMAGYMKLLGTEVLDAYPMRVLNLHPALLPSFPGAHAIQDAFDFGVKITGITVHFANEVFDDGPIVAQAAVRVLEDDSVETLEARIHEAEHRLYPAVLAAVADGRVTVEGRRVHVRAR